MDVDHLPVRSWICDSRLRVRLRVVMAAIPGGRRLLTVATAATLAELVRVTAGRAAHQAMVVVLPMVEHIIQRRAVDTTPVVDALRADIPAAEDIPAVAAIRAAEVMAEAVIAKKLGDVSL
jgi:hypothetical protein